MLLVATLALAVYAVPSSAFCVYNNDIVDVTFFAWPIAAQTFKAVVPPGGNACCNWADDTCFAASEGDTDDDPLGQCAGVVFYITPRNLDTNSITQKFIAKEVEEKLAPLVGVLGLGGLLLGPVEGAVVGVTAAFAAAGLDEAAQNTETGIDFGPYDQWVHGINGGTVNWIRPNHIEVTTAAGC